MAKARGKISKKLKPETELQLAVHTWLLVMFEFDQWRQQLSKVIVGCTRAASTGFCVGDSIAVANLRLLETELMEELKNLTRQIDQLDQPGELALKQVVEHTNIIRQWSQKIQYALSVEARGIA